MDRDHYHSHNELAAPLQRAEAIVPCKRDARERYFTGYNIARLSGIDGNVSRPGPWAMPSDLGRFTAIIPWPRANTIMCTMYLHVLTSYTCTSAHTTNREIFRIAYLFKCMKCISIIHYGSAIQGCSSEDYFTSTNVFFAHKLSARCSI